MLRDFLKIFLIIYSSFSIAEVKIINDNFRGEGKFTWYFFDVYHGKLWASNKTDIFSKPISLELRYLRELEGKDITDQSVKELKNIGLKSKDISPWYKKMLEIFPDVSKGDSILANYSPEGKIEFYLNRKKKLGEIKDLTFSKQFMGIWLDERTSAKEFRLKLLGGKL